jgi:hypothetical protein
VQSSAGQSQESVDQNLDFTERPNQVQYGGGNRGSFLNLDPSVDYEEQPVSHESIDINSQEEEASRVSQESSYVNSQEEPSKVPHESVDVNSQEEASKAASQEADDHNDSQE